jgi:uncharacterized protein involved in type VI secretion and phage assembly
MTVDDLERTVAELVRQVERRYHGKYRGIVVDNADPERLARLKAQVPSVLGDEVVTGWALPCVPYGGQPGQGWLAVPRVGAGVWVEFEEGDLEFPVWVGTFWSRPGGSPETPPAVAADGTVGDVADPPTRTVLTTAKGHTIQIEDADDADLVLIHEATNGHTIALDADGIRITDGFGNAIAMSSDGVLLSDAGGSSIALTGDAVTIHSATSFTLDAPGQSVEIVADAIDLRRG